MSEEREEWRAVVGYEGLYEVSDHGQVRSVDRIIPDPRGWSRRLRGRVLHPGLHSSGGGRKVVALSRDGLQPKQLVAHLVAEAFLGPRPVDMVVRHLNDDPSDDQLENLAYGTVSENCYDRVANGKDHESNKIQCPRRHLLMWPNLVKSAAEAGTRNCLACARARANVQKHPERDFVTEADRHYRAIMGEAEAA